MANALHIRKINLYGTVLILIYGGRRVAGEKISQKRKSANPIINDHVDSG